MLVPAQMNQSPIGVQDTSALLAASRRACLEDLRRWDRDRFLLSLFARPEYRNEVQALFALNAELARIAVMVGEPGLAQIRLQWWREAVHSSLQGQRQQHHLLITLQAMHRRCPLPEDVLAALFDAWAEDLNASAFVDLADLRSHGSALTGSLLRLVLHAMGIADDATGLAADHAAMAWSTMALIRAQVFWAGRQRVIVPSVVLARHGALAEDILDLRHTPALRLVFQELVADVLDHADRARTALAQAPKAASMPKAALPVLLHVGLAESYARRLAAMDYDIFAKPIEIGQVRKIVSLTLKAWRGAI